MIDLKALRTTQQNYQPTKDNLFAFANARAKHSMQLPLVPVENVYECRTKLRSTDRMFQPIEHNHGYAIKPKNALGDAKYMYPTNIPISKGKIIV